jgi:hypothetical protein
MEEGMQRGRDLGYQEGQAAAYEQSGSRAEDIMERLFNDDQGSPTPILCIIHHLIPNIRIHPWIIGYQNKTSTLGFDCPLLTIWHVHRLLTHRLLHLRLSLRGMRKPALMIPAPHQHLMDYGYDLDAPRRLPHRGARLGLRSRIFLVHRATMGYNGDKLSIIHEANSAEGTPSQRTLRI